jgi:hypothetical protein
METYNYHKLSTPFLLKLFCSLFLVAILILNAILSTSFLAYAAYTKAIPAAGGPTITDTDPNLKVQTIF